MPGTWTYASLALTGLTASGVLASLHVAYNCPEGLPRRRLEVIGTAGQLVAENTMGQDPGGTVIAIDGRTGQRETIPVSNQSPFTAQVRQFGAALRLGDWREFSAERDLHTMRLLAEAYRTGDA